MSLGFNRAGWLYFAGFTAISIIAFAFAIVTEKWIVATLPVVILLATIGVLDFRKIFYLLLFFTPFSMEFQVSHSLGTDLPTEPLMIMLMLLFMIYALSNPAMLGQKFFKHPIILALIVHWAWIGYSTIYSVEFLKSFKFFLAKCWYIIVFAIMAPLIIRDEKGFRKVFWLVFIPLTLTVIQTLIRHAMVDFEFSLVNKTVTPFYRNHVNYAVFITLFLPFAIVARYWYPAWSIKRIMINSGILLIFSGIFFAYTRACWLALIVAAIAWMFVRLGIFKHVLIAVTVLLTGLTGFLAHNNRYLEFAPEYEKTIYHEELEEHLEATVKLQDVSSMERIYRWIAALRMIKDKPLTGFGPGNFYPYYKGYTVNKFRTYVSDNEERSTVHNYFLLVLSEQGIPGLLIFLILTFLIFFHAQRIYHQSGTSERKRFAMALILSLVIIYVNLMLADLVEVDKIGTLYFMFIGLLVMLDIHNKPAKPLHGNID